MSLKWFGVLFAVFASWTGCSPSFDGCTTDAHCKGGRVCHDGRCAYLDEVPASEATGEDLDADVGSDVHVTGAEAGNPTPTQCGSAADCDSDQTCTGDGLAGACADYWYCDGFGEGLNSDGACFTSWFCGDVDYSFICSKNSDSGSRCECRVDNELVHEFLYEDGEGCGIRDKHHYANWRCGWRVSPANP